MVFGLNLNLELEPDSAFYEFTLEGFPEKPNLKPN